MLAPMNESGATPKIESFYLKQMSFESGVLRLDLGSETTPHATVIFDFVRTFIFLRESDFYGEFAKYEHERLIAGPDRTSGVFRITKSSILDRLTAGLEMDRPNYYWVSTPDECLEVASFGEPKVAFRE